MGFASGAITFKRFFVNGDSFERVDEELLEMLAARSISKDPVRAADHTEIGWITGEHILDTQFDFAKNAIADGLHFSMRIDTNKAPADLVRSYQRINEQAMLEASGREFLSKAEKREAREQALSRADKEARSGQFRKMKAIPVFFDLKRNEVYLGTAGSNVVDQFTVLFRETFDRGVIAASSGEMAARWAALAGEGHAFDTCEPTHFVNPPEGAELALPEFAGNEGRTRDFLGTEWLTWLWYTAQAETPEITTQIGQSITVLFEKSLLLECAYKVSGKTSISGESPARLPETPVAISGGKRPVKSGLQFAAHGELFSASIRGDAMNFAGVQVSAPQDVKDPRAIFEDRIDKLRTFIDATGDLYQAFLRRRLSTKWSQTLASIRTYIAGTPRTAELGAA